MNIREVIVVEGKSDVKRLKNLFPNIRTIQTNGLAISKNTYKLIKDAKKEYGVIILTDPDPAGFDIRQMINNYVPGCKHAYVPMKDAINKNSKKRKIGIAYASKDAILKALKYARHKQFELKFDDFVKLGIIGGDNSKNVRQYICKKLGIKYSNSAKSFRKKIKLNYICYEELRQFVDEYKEGDENED